MITDSETFRPVTVNLDTTSSFTDPVLLHETANARLYRMSKAGKHFIIKTTKDNSAMQLSILKREYEMSISFNHYHIAHHYTYETQTPIGPGIVMEYIDGRNLSEYLAENPSSDSRRRVFYQILDAVAYIHKCGIIHNDLKPENILISRANNDVKLIDFGLSDNDAHYLAKTLGCTPTFASPELLSHGSAIDARSDIYSLGRIMQLIFGRKYHKMSQKCINSDPNRRYDNVDQLRRQWLKAQRSPFITIMTALLLIALPISFYIGRQSSHQEITITKNKLDSIAKTQAETLFAQSQRKAMQDSLINNIDNRLDNIYTNIKNELSKIPFAEFASNYISQHSQEAIDIYSAISNIDVDHETRTMLHSHYDSKWVNYYNELCEIAFTKPTISRETLSEDEYNYYINLLDNNQPYTPYTSTL